MKNAKPPQCNSRRNRLQVDVRCLDTSTSVSNSTSCATRSGSTTRDLAGVSQTKNSNDDGSNSPSHLNKDSSSPQPLHNAAILGGQPSVQSKKIAGRKRRLELGKHVGGTVSTVADKISSSLPSSPPRRQSAQILANESDGDGENTEPNSPQKKKHSSRGNATSSPDRSALLPITRNNNNGIEQDDDREEEDDVDETLHNLEDNNVQHNRPMVIDNILPCEEKNNEQIKSENDLIERCGRIVMAVIDTRTGDIILPYGVCWDDINLGDSSIPQIWDIKRAGALVYFHVALNKGGYSRHPGSRYTLGYQKTHDGKSPIAVLFDVHRMSPVSHRVLSDEISKLIDDCGSPFGKDKTYAEAKCQDMMDCEEKSSCIYFRLICHILKMLEGMEPRTIREIIMGLVGESGIQHLCPLIDQKSAVHEMIRKGGSTQRSRVAHTRCAHLVDGLFQHEELTVQERALLLCLIIQMTVVVSWPPRVKGGRISDIGDWTEFPSFTVLVTSMMLQARNTVGNIVMVDVMKHPPPGDNAYNVHAYPDDDIIDGFKETWLPQLESFLESSEPVDVKGFDTFEYMWQVLQKSELFAEILASPEWLEIEERYSEKYGQGLNAIKYLIYRGFKPFWHPTATLTALLLRTKKGLRVTFVYRPVCWIGHSGPLEKKEGTSAHAALIDQRKRVDDPYILYLMNLKLQEANAQLTTSKNLGDFPLLGNLQIAADLRAYATLCLHAD